jgi:hypothetical protein
MRIGNAYSKSMRTIILVSLLAMATLNMPLVFADEGHFLVWEDFESYSPGSRPPSFQLIEDGSGPNNQVVTDYFAYGGSKSFQLQGKVDSFGSIKQDFTNPRADMGLAAHMMSEQFTNTTNSQGLDNVNIALGFSYSESTDYYGCILFSETGNIVFDDGNDQSILMPYEAYEWYQCALLVNYTTNKIGAFIDGRLLVTSDLSIDFQTLDCIRISSGESGVTGYIDDLSLFAYTEPAILPSTSIYLPMILIPIAVILIGIPGVLFFKHVRSTRGRTKRALKIEEIMKVIGLGAPMLSIGLAIMMNNKAFGESYREIMITLGAIITGLSLLIVSYILSKMRMELDG